MSVILFPFKLVFAVVLLPLRIVQLPLKLFGFRGTLAFAAGVGVGLLVAPRPGEETREMLRERYEEWDRQRAETWGPPAGSDTHPG